jgi:hypothetical protein
LKRSIGLVAAIALLASALAGCSSQTNPSFVVGTKLVIGVQSPLENLNAGVATNLGSAAAAQELAYLTMPSFYSRDAAGTLQPNTEFGSVKLVGFNRVQYSLTGKAKWTDGKPDSGQDLKLSVLAATTGFDPLTGLGLNSNLRFTSLAGARPSNVSETGITLSYKHLPADWQTNLPVTVAAHLVSTDGELGDTASAQTATNYVNNTAFAIDGVPKSIPKKLLVTSGAYKIASASANAVTLEHNPDFAWGPAPTIDKLIVKAFPGMNGLLKAIKLNQVDLAMPVESASGSRSQIEDAIKASTGSVTTGIGAFNESVIFNHGSGSAFNAGTYNGDSAKAKFLASAFLNLVPRAGIYSTLLATSSLNKTDSLAFAFGTSDYSSSIQQNGTASHQYQNAELAQEKWQKAGFERTIKIRVLFDSNNPRAQLEYTQFAQWAKVSGFTLENVASDDFSKVLETGGSDVYIAVLLRMVEDL